MSNFLPLAKVQEIHARLLAAESIREIVRAAGVAKNSVQRYKGILIGPDDRPIICPCGQAAGHRGWCSHRYAKSPARQAFIAQWLAGRPPKIIRVRSERRVNLNYPFLPRVDSEIKGTDLILLVNGAVPKGLPEQLRADVCQEILAAVISGEIAAAEISTNVKRFISQTRKLSESHYMAFSIDQPRRDGRSWHDFLSAESIAE